MEGPPDPIAVGPTPKTLAEKVDFLFREIHPRGRKSFTHPEVAQATGLSTGLLSALRSGKNANPTKETIEKLAQFFGVPAAFFFDDQTTEQVRVQIGLVAQVRDSAIASAAARLVGLSQGSLEAVVALANQLRKIEGIAEDKSGPN